MGECASYNNETGRIMGFLQEIFHVYKLYKNGELDSLSRFLAQSQEHQKKIDADLCRLSNDIRMSKVQMGQVQDTLIRKNLNLPTDVDISAQHKSFALTYRVIAAGCSPFLVGPAGSGKSTILSQIATAMNLPFYPMSVNSLTSDYNIIGYNDANGKYVPTIFRQAYEHGGLFSFEEIGNYVWQGYIESDRKNIMVTASRLRKKLENYPGLSNYIETVWSKGYKFGNTSGTRNITQ